MKERDLQLDMYRGLVMIYILCVIHVTYSLGLAPEPWRSVILFEMPVIFFISGASVAVASSRHGVKGTAWSRFKRVLLPYYAYIFYTAIIVCAIAAWSHFSGSTSTDIDLSVKKFAKALIPHDWALDVPYMSHLWFVIPYLAVSCVFPFFRGVVDRLPRAVTTGILLASCVAVVFVPWEIVREIVIYNFFFVIGYLYYKKLSVRWMAAIAGLSAVILAVCVVGLDIGIMPMQAHKFPPDLIFLIYGVGALALLGILFSYVKIPNFKLLEIWNKRGYTIYLWQNYFFIAVALIVGMEFDKRNPEANPLLFIISAVAILVLGTVMSGVLVKLENAITGLVGELSAKRR